MSKASREKGKRGEREVAAILDAAGFPARRAQQFAGGASSFDVSCPALETLGLRIEVKRTEKTAINEWLATARRDCQGQDLLPIVVHRSNRSDWRVYMTLDDFIELIQRMLRRQ
jgi:Holliday junction resolvase